MNIKIKKEVFSKFPDLRVAFILVKDIDNKSKLKEAKQLLEQEQKLIRLTLQKENVKNHHLISPWELARADLGKKAVHYQTSVERLVNKVLKGRSVAARDTLTTLLRYFALKNIIPFGLDDFCKIRKGLTFSVARGTEKVSPLRKLSVGSLYYKDEKFILGEKLNFWKSSKTELTGKSRDVLLHLEALPPINKKKLLALVKEIRILIDTFCGGESKVLILDKKAKSGSLR